MPLSGITLAFSSNNFRKYNLGGYLMNLSAKNKKSVVDPVCGMAVVPGIKEIITTCPHCHDAIRKNYGIKTRHITQVLAEHTNKLLRKNP